MMNRPEAVKYNEGSVAALRKLVLRGEGPLLEFKRKASHPDKIVRELIAFANVRGGTLLIGVDDGGGIPGVKYPDEELMAVQQALYLYCEPEISIAESIVALSAQRFVVRIDVLLNENRPHYFKTEPSLRESYVRAGDMSVKASREMLEIVRRSKHEKNVRFTFGEAEKSLMEYLEQKNSISLTEFRALTRLNRSKATRKLILLVLANVLRISPTEKGDLYSRI